MMSRGGHRRSSIHPRRTDGPTSSSRDEADVARWDWTSGFLDERLVEPVSPLGWSVLRRDLEEIAFREPLRFLGVDPRDLAPITRLWRGHPYVNVAVFEALYKLFPDWLLPEDAWRFFPGGDVARRKRAPRPTSLFSPSVWIGLLGALIRSPTVISPFHNDAAWGRFERRYVATIGAIATRVDGLERERTGPLAEVIDLLGQIEAANRELLRIHRWSLTIAEVWYSLLRRVASRLLGATHGAAFAAAAVSNLEDQSVRLNRALRDLARGAANASDEERATALGRFLATYGHRSFSLDLIRPCFAAEPTQVLDLLREGATDPQPGESPGGVGILPARVPGRRLESRAQEWLLDLLADLGRRFARLREDQRFAWQRGLAQMRRLYLLAGHRLADGGVLASAEDVFFLTADEVCEAARGGTAELRDLATRRRTAYADQQDRFAREGPGGYPRFLRGDQPLRIESSDWPSTHAAGTATPLHGQPVSPGIGRGRARVVDTPEDLAAVQPGEVLVARSADPAWTLVFDRLAALVTESGGQLSHAAVVAREFSLPAVLAVPRATEVIHTGDELVADGATGAVEVESRGADRQYLKEDE